MNFVVFIDYANLFINIKNAYGLSNISNIEDKICECINKTTSYIKNCVPNREINILASIAYVLPDECFGNPSMKLKQNSGVVCRIVDEDRRYKDREMKEAILSRNDDRELARGIIDVIKDERVHGVFVISNDNDFIGSAEKVHSIGKYYWCGAFETKYKNNSEKRIICGKKIRNISDKTIPIYDIMQGNDEGEVYNEILGLREDEKTIGPRLEIFKDGKLIVSYPINKKNISIGRRSLRRKHIPMIDLTEFDKEKIMSRQHANIRKVNNRLIFYVNDKCSRPTWYNSTHRVAGSQFTLEPDKATVMGDKDGFILFYKNK